MAKYLVHHPDLSLRILLAGIAESLHKTPLSKRKAPQLASNNGSLHGHKDESPGLIWNIA